MRFSENKEVKKKQFVLLCCWNEICWINFERTKRRND